MPLMIQFRCVASRQIDSTMFPVEHASHLLNSSHSCVEVTHSPFRVEHSTTYQCVDDVLVSHWLGACPVEVSVYMRLSSLVEKCTRGGD